MRALRSKVWCSKQAVAGAVAAAKAELEEDKLPPNTEEPDVRTAPTKEVKQQPVEPPFEYTAEMMQAISISPGCIIPGEPAELREARQQAQQATGATGRQAGTFTLTAVEQVVKQEPAEEEVAPMDVELQGSIRSRGDSPSDAEGEAAKKRREDREPPGEPASSSQQARVELVAEQPPDTAAVVEPPVGYHLRYVARGGYAIYGIIFFCCARWYLLCTRARGHWQLSKWHGVQ
jgi:hypothetical protein